jgi:predicted dehydrogenase
LLLNLHEVGYWETIHAQQKLNDVKEKGDFDQMKQQVVNVGVIGVGWFGNFHSRIYDYMAGSNLVGVYDLDQKKVEGLASDLGVIGYKSLDQMLSDDSIEAVSICVKDQFHLEPVIAACNAGKHIFLEKPLALTLEECDQIIEASKDADIKLMIGHLLRFNNNIRNAYTRIRAGEIGEISHFYARRNMPRTAPRHVGDCCGFHTMLYHGAVHELDLIQWLANDEIVEVYAKSINGQMTSEGCDVSDTILSMLELRSGALAMLEHSWIYTDNFPAMVDGRAEITGTHGRIELDLGFRGGIRYNPDGVVYFDNPHWPVIDDWYSCDLRNELETFIRCIALDQPVPVTGSDGRRTIAVALAIESSLNSGKPEKVRS